MQATKVERKGEESFILHPDETPEEVKDQLILACIVVLPFLIMAAVMTIAIIRRIA